jgi:hypothetical protein
MTIDADKLALGIVRRLAPILPLGLRADADDGSVVVFADAGQTHFDIRTLLALEPDSRAQQVAVVAATLSHIQDFVAIELRLPWPGVKAMPIPFAVYDDSQICWGFEGEGDERTELEPISWSEISLK